MRLVAAVLLMIIALPVSKAGAALDQRLAARLEQLPAGEELSVIATLADQVDLGRFRNQARNLGAISVESRRQHRQELIEALKNKVALTQRPLQSFLQGRGIRKIEPLWIFNGFEMTAGRAVIEALAARPEVAQVRLNDTLQPPGYTIGPAAAPEWNLSAIHAPELWQLGFTGQGVVVATLDFGVDVNHADLGPRWRGGANSWYDPYGEHPNLPVDLDGHGTAVMGVLVGGSATGTAIGVAPDARWIAGKIFNDAGLAEIFRIHQGMQWLLDPDGNAGTDDAPDVVNLSWGFVELPGVCDPEFQADIQALRAAGLAVAMAAGNNGPFAGSSVSPANYSESFAVGAVDRNLAVALFSARGPSACDGTIYPEVVAPGFQVKTADLTFGGLFPTLSTIVDGTSFAAPHVAGAMALLLSAFPEQPVNLLETALRQTAVDLPPAGADNSSGSGLINALAAFNYLDSIAPNLAVLPSPTFFNFGTVPINATASQAFTVTNAGTLDLELGTLAVTGPHVTEFTLGSDLCSGRTLPQGIGCTFAITFAPQTAGRKTATVRIPSNDPDTPLAGIVLVGNELDRIGTFRKGQWFLDNGSGGWEAGDDTVYAGFGGLADRPVTADVNGDGFSEAGVYRPATGQWFFDLDNSGSWGGCSGAGGADLCLARFGAPADLPVTGDWDGDGRFEVGVYRQGRWYFDRDGSGTWNPGVDAVYANFGAAGDLPVTGDWNGDGRTEIGTFRQGTWFIDFNGNGQWDNIAGGDRVYTFGVAGDLPVTGDWNNDGITEIGVYRQGRWFLDNGNGRWDPGADAAYVSFGAPDDIPVSGNWP